MSKLLMREEVLTGGAPLPLVDLLGQVSDLTIQDELVKAAWSQAMYGIRYAVSKHTTGIDIVMPKLWEGDAKKKSIVESLGVQALTLDSYDTTGALPLRVSRHFSKGGVDQLVIGERPGSASLTEQLDKLATAEPVALLEDDMFTGGTAKHVIELMQDKGFSILKFIPGLQVSAIKEISGVPIEPLEQFDSSEVLDVVDPRDFLFGLKDAGLTINDNGFLYRAPYIIPWVDVSARASIPTGVAEAFSRDMTELNHWFYGVLEAITRSPILVSHTDPAFQSFVSHETDYPLEQSMKGFCEYMLD